MCKGTGARSSIRCLKNSKLSDIVGAVGSGGGVVWRAGGRPGKKGVEHKGDGVGEVNRG